MTQLQVKIVNPRAGRLLRELAAMDLIVITKPENPKKAFRALLTKLRSQSDVAPSLEEITRDVEDVRILASEKVLASDWLKPEEDEAWNYL